MYEGRQWFIFGLLLYYRVHEGMGVLFWRAKLKEHNIIQLPKIVENVAFLVLVKP